MVICRYFLQGNCRFGANCRNEHSQNANPGHTSILRSPQQSNANDQIDTANLIRTVSNDIIAAEKGKQWVLSCYAPIKEKPNFPEFDDYSFEEIRLQCYEAQKNGTIEQYKLNLNKLLLEAMQRMKMLQNPSGEIVNIIRKIYFAPNTQAIVTGSTFNSNTNQKSNSPFGAAANTSNSIFGSKPSYSQQPSSFGLQQNTFVNTQSTTGSIFAQKPPATGSIFGGPVTQNSTQVNQVGFAQNAGIFGQTNKIPQNNIQANANIFNQQVCLPNQPQNAFALPNVNVTLPPFTQQNSIFGGTPASVQSTSIFGNSPVTTQNSFPIFGNTQTTTQSPVFAGKSPMNQGSVFGTAVTNQTQNIFASPISNESKNVLIGSTNFDTNTSNSGPIFGGNKQSVLSPGSTSIYSQRGELSEQDIKVFSGDSFTFGNIPELPPLAEMC